MLPGIAVLSINLLMIKFHLIKKQSGDEKNCFQTPEIAQTKRKKYFKNRNKI